MVLTISPQEVGALSTEKEGEITWDIGNNIPDYSPNEQINANIEVFNNSTARRLYAIVFSMLREDGAILSESTLSFEDNEGNTWQAFYLESNHVFSFSIKNMSANKTGVYLALSLWVCSGSGNNVALDHKVSGVECYLGQKSADLSSMMGMIMPMMMIGMIMPMMTSSMSESNK